ncbi:MAG TPA: CocE/NonD family hydrolase [Solirubrobacteraceae bacterium]|nr:CocE/NonD family hydrolase [Solirubrobacteraceae bacterium]
MRWVRALGAIVLLAGLAAPASAVAAGTARGRAQAHGSVDQVYATGVRPRAPVRLVDRRGVRIAAGRADSLGGIVFRHVVPGVGYRVRAGSRWSAPLTVLPDRPAPPSRRIYDQRLPAAGYGYLRTRDGTTLAIDVHLPGPAGGGPYPTLVEYSGYGYADPAGPESGIAPIANLLGFAVVDVNMRGTGCSGGSFDYFEALQSLDGYDVVEAVARQPWVLGHRVGMMGISYGGISQLFVAATDPPHLTAIAPLSVIDNTATTLYPGGILNTGFALAWGRERAHDALPASRSGGQPWALKRIEQGDRTCRANQALHGEAPNPLREVRANQYYVPSVADPLNPITFVARIHVPVYLACQWTDEQTGAHCPDLAGHFTGTRRRWFTFTNGAHIDSLDPETFNRWYDFLELYVAHRAPHLTPATVKLAPAVFAAAMGITNLTLPADPIQSEPTYSAARAAFQRLAPVRVLFDNGAGSSTPGAPYPAFQRSFSRFPIQGTRARSWYLGRRGSLTPQPGGSAGSDEFRWNPRSRSATSFAGRDDGSPGGLWTATPSYHWDQSPPGSAASYVTARLAADTVIIGAGAVELWMRASAPSVDLQVTISEVRPDGRETFVQDGWVRTSERTLDPRQRTLLAPVLSLRRRDAAPLPHGRYTEVTVPLYYEGHAYRRGSRIRLIVQAAGGDQPVWAFAQTRPRGTATVRIARSLRLASRLILPVVPGIGVPTGLPPCSGLRGEPCRPYRPYVNRSAALG